MENQEIKNKERSLLGSHINFSREEDEKHVLEIIRDTSIALHNGEFKTIIGPSGCGKTTLLSILSGLLKPNSGKVLLNGIEINDLTEKIGLPTPSDIGIVFQDYGLFPWRTVARNVSFGLEINNVPKDKGDISYREKDIYIDEIGAEVKTVLNFGNRYSPILDILKMIL